MVRLLVLVLALASPAALGADVYYVRAGGSDSNNGQSPAQAFATIGRASGNAGPGDTVHIGAGTYTGTVEFTRSGTADQPIRMLADTGGTHTGDAGAVTIEQSGSQWGITIRNAHHLQITGVAFRGGQQGLNIDSSQSVVLDGCVIENTVSRALNITNGATVTLSGSAIRGGGDGALVGNGGLWMTDSLITGLTGTALTLQNSGCVGELRRCRVIDVGAGLTTGNGTLTVINTLIHEVDGDAIRTWNSTALTVVQCTIDGVGGSGARFMGTATLYNNIFTNIGSDCMRLDNGSVTASHNLCYAYSGSRSANFNADEYEFDPLYTDRAADLFGLRAGSGAIDAGTDTSSYTGVDLSGLARPVGAGTDLGVFEFDASSGLTFAPVPYRTSFVSLGTEWSGAVRTVFPQLGGAAGEHGKRDGADESIELGLSTLPGSGYLLVYEVIAFDDWEYTGINTDYFDVAIDGTSVLRTRIGPSQIDRAVNLNGIGVSDRVSTLNWVRFVAGTSQTRARFRGIMTNDISSKGWAIDEVVARGLADIGRPLPMADTFDGGMPDDGWIGTEHGDASGDGFHGPFSADNRNAGMLVARTEPNKMYEITFDLLLIGGWEDDEEVRVRVNAADVLARSLGNGVGQPDRQRFKGTEAADESSQASGAARAFRGVRASFEADSDYAMIEFRSNSDAGAAVQSWAIDNVTVRPRGSGVRVIRWREVSPIGEGD